MPNNNKPNNKLFDDPVEAPNDREPEDLSIGEENGDEENGNEIPKLPINNSHESEGARNSVQVESEDWRIFLNSNDTSFADLVNGAKWIRDNLINHHKKDRKDKSYVE